MRPERAAVGKNRERGCSAKKMENNVKKDSLIAKLIAPLTFLVGAVILGWQLQADQEYMFFYRESQQLLFLEWDYFRDLILQFGGLGIAISQSLVQFFIHPVVGAIITALLGAGSAALLWLSMRKISRAQGLLPLLFAPALIQILYLIDSYHHYTGLVALFFMALTLWLYTLCSERDYRLRLAAGLVLTMALYLGFGSIGALFAVVALIYDLVQRRDRWYLGAIYAAVVAVAGSYMVSRGSIADYDAAYGPKFYYEFYIEVTTFLQLMWWAVVALPLCFFAAAKLASLPRWSGVVAYVMLAFVTGGLYMQHNDKELRRKRDVYAYMELYHNIANENWEEIVTSRNINYQLPLHLNCVNFALSKRGELLDKLFLYPQQNSSSLMHEMSTYVEEHSIYSEIYYHLGIVSQTLELSLAAMAGTYPGTPLLLQQFVRSRIVMGDYDLAGKFVYRLSKTYGYRDWAERQWQFLHNDAAVEADEEYGLKRRTLPELSSEFVSLRGLLYDLMKVLTANPQNTVARDYVIACLLLDQNFDNIRYFVENYYDTPVLPELPVRLQEAVVTYSERDMDYCRRYGVSEQTIARFASFRQKVLALRHQRTTANPKQQLPEFRDTFWYFMLK